MTIILPKKETDLHPKSYMGPHDKMNTLQVPSTKKYMFPQKHLKIRFGAIGGPFSSASFPFAALQLSAGTGTDCPWHSSIMAHSWPSGPHSARSSVLLLCWVCVSFPGGKQGREHTFLALLTSLIRIVLRAEQKG